MPGSDRVTYKLRGENNITFDIYKTKDLLLLSDEFKVNRSFQSWAEVFQKSLTRHRKDIAYKKRSKEKIARVFPPIIISMFWESVCNDLIYNEAEVILKDSIKPENRFALKMGYLHNAPKVFFMKRTKLVFPFGGMHYTLRMNYPKNWNDSALPRRAGFFPKYRTKVRKEIRSGRRYFNSTKEKIFAKL